jgi:hypothetical protein
MFEQFEGCLFCNSTAQPLYKVFAWDKPDRFSWYCGKHYKDVEQFQQQHKRAFIEAYRSPTARATLSPHSLELWERLNK